jgi:hypothetical protein
MIIIILNCLLMNNPYFLYPGYPVRGYPYHKEYNQDLLRLYDYIKTFDYTSCKLLHITIGAAMEEVSQMEDYDKIYKKYSHWRQLLPEFIDMLVVGCPVRVIIISPNESFRDCSYKDPEFIKYTNDYYDWKRDNKSYKSQQFDITVDIFCTMMPHEEMERNKRLTSKIGGCNVQQTDIDVNFIKEFYGTLENVVCDIEQFNGVVSCFSFAVFSEESELSIFNDYRMFIEIKNVFTFEKRHTRLLCRWLFRLDSQTMLVHNSNKRINYVYMMNNDIDIIKMLDNQIMINV